MSRPGPATHRAVVAGLLALHWLIAVSALREKSTMFDEIAHLTAGYSYWLTGDIRLQPEGGTLPQRWAALPLLFGGFRFPSLDQAAWWNSDAYAMGYHFFYDLGNDVGAMLGQGRAMMGLLALPLGVLVYAWSRRLFGRAGGLLSLAIFTFCPTMLANGPLINSDTAATLFFLATLWAWWTMLHRLTPATVAMSALAMAALFVSKQSGVLVVFVVAILTGIRLVVGRPLATPRGEVRARPRQLALLLGAGLVHVAVAVAVIWTFHGFRYAAFRNATPERDNLGWEMVAPVPAPIVFAREHRLLPEAFLYAYAYVLHFAQERRAFLDGEHSWKGFWLYFPYSLAVKTPLPLFALLFLAAGAAVARRRGPPGLYETAPLWVFLAVYWAAALASHLNAGHRHLMPTYPPMFVLAGAAAHWLTPGRRAMTGLVAATLAWLVVDAAAIWPHYLAYFNALAGGPRQGYRRLVDSSLDWGQDLPGLKRWLDRQGLGGEDGPPVFFSYFGTGSPEYYGIRAKRLPGYYDHWRRAEWYGLTGGVYCISATNLQSIFVGAPGPWAAPYEERYQAELAELRAIAAAKDPEERMRRTREAVMGWLGEFEQLRFSRLAAYLRQREPDDQVGYSILIYRLSDEDARQATVGPPAELRPKVEVEGFTWPPTTSNELPNGSGSAP